MISIDLRWTKLMSILLIHFCLAVSSVVLDYGIFSRPCVVLPPGPFALCDNMTVLLGERKGVQYRMKRNERFFVPRKRFGRQQGTILGSSKIQNRSVKNRGNG